MSTTPAQFKIDGVWVLGTPAEDLGALGQRYVCDLAKAPGEPSKMMLLRLKDWTQTGLPHFVAPVPLHLQIISEAKDGSLRAVKGKLYQRAATTANGHAGAESCTVFQQDVSGLASLKESILRARAKGDTHQVWQLFFAACKALNRFGKAFGAGQAVPLQCPGSLAVGPKNRIILLDAEIRVGGEMATAPDAKQLYAAWFGEKGKAGLADPQGAALMHSRALLLFFRQLLGSVQQQPGGTPPALAKVAAHLGQIPSDVPVDEMEEWVRNNGEDWSLPVEEDEADPTAGPPVVPSVERVPVRTPKKRRSVLLLFSGCLNLLLALTVGVLLGLVGTGVLGWRALAGREPGTQIDSAVLFSSYCVVFPTQGTIGEKVNATLSELFPGKVQEVRRSPAERDRLLEQKMKDVVQGLPEPEKLKQLLDRLTAEYAIRFKGFAAGGPSDGLTAIVDRGGIFTISGSKEEHGSLLQTDSLEKILSRANLPDAQEAKRLLATLRNAVAEYASLKDALSIIGDRPAFLVAVEPTAAGHDATRKKLLSRLDKPVFSSRPVPGLFDAVDPTSDTGGGSAVYTLRLERPCFWRAASKEDRNNVDFVGNATNDRLKWQTFAANQLIEWQPLPLKKKNGKTEPAVSFDIAVVLGNKVVVFRNQNILLGDTKKEVVKQARDYIDQGLKLGLEEIEEGVNVRQQDRQVAGALNYSYLADLVRDSGGDLEVNTKAEFEKRRKEEDEMGAVP